MPQREKYKVIGIMSGTSMDGVDLACCELHETEGRWKYEIKAAETVPYSEVWRVRLSKLNGELAINYVKTNVFYGHYLGGLVADFVKRNSLSPDLVGSHGHTIFHQPQSGFTAQVGDGAALSAISGLPVVCDFRTTDVALGGQGAPLVPIGDKLLFPEYDSCMNLGGIANISLTKNDRSTAYDICPANIVLNRLARILGKEYDEGGAMAEKGSLNYELLSALNKLPYYSSKGPKSMGREWINQEFWPLFKNYEISVEDRLKTVCEHIGVQVAASIDEAFGEHGKGKKILCTGGGAFNSCLMEHIQSHTDAQISIPDEETVQYKEALIFAFLGVLRIKNQVNCLRSVTGARKDNIGGALYGDFTGLLD
jgi:anhydro-N-acetylmuramic acid kinase